MSSYVQSVSQKAVTPLAYLSNNGDGNLLVATFGQFNGTLPTAVADTQLNTWVLASTSNGSNAGSSMWIVIGCKPGANTVTPTGFAGTAGGPSMALAEYAAPATGSFNLFAMAGGVGQNFPGANGLAQGITATLVIISAYDKSTSHSWTGVGVTVRESTMESGGQSFVFGDSDQATLSLGTSLGFSGGGANTVAVNMLIFAQGGGGGGGLAANPLGGFVS